MAPNPDRDPAVEIALIRADLEAMQEDLKAVRKELKDLLEAWNTATGMVRFVKWLSTFATALAVLAAAKKAAQAARAGEGPTLIECKTYRYRGHSRFEPAVYRTKEEENEWKQRDPDEDFSALLMVEAVFDENRISPRPSVEPQVAFLRIAGGGQNAAPVRAGRINQRYAHAGSGAHQRELALDGSRSVTNLHRKQHRFSGFHGHGVDNGRGQQNQSQHHGRAS